MVDLTANHPDGSLEPRPDQIVDVPLIELLDDSVDLTPGHRLGARQRDYAGEYAALREALGLELQRLASILPELAPGGPGSLEGATTSVADLARAGLVAYRGPEPVSVSEQLDTEFLRGFLRSPSNMRRSTSASGTHRLDGRGARIPGMGIEAQRRYGSAFQALTAFEEGRLRVDDLSRQLAEVARDGLTSGALVPEQ